MRALGRKGGLVHEVRVQPEMRAMEVVRRQAAQSVNLVAELGSPLGYDVRGDRLVLPIRLVVKDAAGEVLASEIQAR